METGLKLLETSIYSEFMTKPGQPPFSGLQPQPADLWDLTLLKR